MSLASISSSSYLGGSWDWRQVTIQQRFYINNFQIYYYCITTYNYRYTYTYTTMSGNIVNNNDERTHFFRKIYLSHFILERVAKGLMLVMCEKWVGDGTDCHKFLCIIAALLPHSAGLLNRGPEGPSPPSGAGSHYSILSPTATGTRTVTVTRTELCLPRTPTADWTKPSVAPGYIIFLASTSFLWASHLHRIQPVHGSRWCLRPDAPVSSAYLHRCIS